MLSVEKGDEILMAREDLSGNRVSIHRQSSIDEGILKHDKLVELSSTQKLKNGSSLDGGSPRRNNLIEGDAGGGEKANSRSPTIERRNTVVE